jgi:hypothetical protein
MKKKLSQRHRAHGEHGGREEKDMRSEVCCGVYE